MKVRHIKRRAYKARNHPNAIVRRYVRDFMDRAMMRCVTQIFKKQYDFQELIMRECYNAILESEGLPLLTEVKTL